MVTLIKKIFTSYKEPLYNRANQILEVKALDLISQIKFLKDYSLLSAKNFLAIYGIFNGVPKYLEFIAENNLKGASLQEIIRFLFCQEDAVLINEGKNILIEEFGKFYDNYFSILAAIACGRTTRNEIYNFTGININSLGALLNHLENFYELIERRVPILEKKSSKLSFQKTRLI